jgi:predicted transcriptional regulator
MLQVLVNVFLESFPTAEKGMWLCKKKSNEKMDKCLDIQNNGYLDACHKKEEKKKEMKKIAHAL